MILTKHGKNEIDLDRLVNDYIKAGRLNELLLIVPTNRKIRYLKRELISSSPSKAAAGINLETIGTFSSKLFFPDDSTKLVSEETAVVLLKQSFQETKLEFFSKYKGEIPFGTLERIKNVISEYKLHGITPEKLIEEAENLDGAEKIKAVDIAAIFKNYRNKFSALGVKEIGDVYHELNNLTADEFSEHFKSNFNDVKTIIINGFDEFTAPEITIIDKTAEQKNIELYIYFDYYKYNPLIFSHLDSCYEKLINKKFKVIKDAAQAEQSAYLNEIKEKLFLKKEKKPDKKNVYNLTEIKAFNRTNEIELIAKEIKNLILEKKVPPNKICVAFNLIKPYSPLVRDQFNLFGIPFNLTDRLSLSTSLPVISVINLLEIIENDFYYKNLFRALSNRFLKLKNYDLTNLMKASVELKIVSGFNIWKERLNDAIIESRYKDESYNEQRRYNVDYDKALKDIHSIYKMLKVFEKKITLRDFYNNLLGLIYNLELHKNLLDGNDNTVEENIKAVTIFLNSVEELIALLEIEYGNDKKFPLKFFLNQIKTLVAFGRYNIKEKPGYGVQVTTLNEIRGLKFDYLFIAGLTDGDFPTRFQPEIFFSGSFATGEVKHQTEERYHFYQSLCSWDKGLYLSHPSTDEKKDLVESNFLIEFKQLFELNTKSSEDYEDTIYSKEEMLRFIGKEIQNNNKMPQIPGEQNINAGQIKKSVEINELRIKHPFEESAYNGILQNDLTDDLKEKLEEKRTQQFSISQLETYAKCPYKYFAERILGLETLEEPSEEIEALEMGSLLHTILYEFYSTITEKKIVLQGANDRDFSTCVKILFGIAGKKIEKLKMNSALTFYEKEKILGIEGNKKQSLLYKFLEKEREASDGFIPGYFELAFGSIGKIDGDKSLTVNYFEIDDVKVRGKIDRIDLNDENEMLKVIDYKLSGKKPTRDELFKGISLQLPLYMYAAKELISAELDKKYKPYASVIYSLKYNENDFGPTIIKTSGKRNLTAEQMIENSNELIRICIDAIKKYTKEIAEGRFNLSTLEDRENKVCRYCEFKSICRIQEIN